MNQDNENIHNSSNKDVIVKNHHHDINMNKKVHIKQDIVVHVLNIQDMIKIMIKIDMTMIQVKIHAIILGI